MSISGINTDLTTVSTITGALTYDEILSDGNTVAWYIADDLTTITKDGSNLVSQWNDKLASGHDLIQATGTNQPLWSANGILFDGVDNYLKTAPFQLVQPEFIYIVIKQVSYTSTDWLFDGNVWTYGGIRQFGGTPYVQACGGAYGSLTNTFAVGSFAVIRLLFKGTDSKLIVNNGTPITGNFGTSGMGGFTLGANGDAAQFSNIQVKEIIIRKVADSVGDEAAIYAYLTDKYGL